MERHTPVYIKSHKLTMHVRAKTTFQQDNNPKHTAKTMQDWLREKSLNVLDWPSQSLDLHPIEHLWRDLKIAVQRRSPSNLIAPERICREEWEKLSKYRCTKFSVIPKKT